MFVEALMSNAYLIARLRHLSKQVLKKSSLNFMRMNQSKDRDVGYKLDFYVTE